MWRTFNPTSPLGRRVGAAGSGFNPGAGKVIDQNCILLLHCEDGADGTNTFLDHALGGNAPHTVTAVGTAQVDTAQKKYGSASALFDGNSDSLRVDDDPDFVYGINPFTIEMWVRLNALPANGTAAVFYSQWVNGDNLIWFYYYNNAGSYQLVFDAWSGGVNAARCFIEPYVLNVDTWYHLAVVRDGNDYDLYVEGVSVANDNNGNAIPDLAADVYLGQSPHPWYLDGWEDEVRVSLVARWAAGGGPYVPAGPFSPYL